MIYSFNILQRDVLYNNSCPVVIRTAPLGGRKLMALGEIPINLSSSRWYITYITSWPWFMPRSGVIWNLLWLPKCILFMSIDHRAVCIIYIYICIYYSHPRCIWNILPLLALSSSHIAAYTYYYINLH